jgi:alkanesulfonate monooxygenase SsuD/methylene tetrahydromethanopterin reductase-like flavin-dependent oxidoreductase (luciferase family)
MLRQGMQGNTPMKQMTLVAFLQAQNCSNYVGSWRHPATMQDYLSPEYYQRIARTLEAGCFHLAFFDDRLAMPDILGHDHAQALSIIIVVAHHPSSSSYSSSPTSINIVIIHHTPNSSS